ncbi:EamA family transporter [Comamonas squillarum]|uniref:EamA domain-containing protein n=1 Tax=Comamonas squillarum TaxID=2977320 RepID=A0ABY6A5I3_9BURK|nr:EamA family transporter [Comamonas sp. PR12]UXC19636.1 hypothetical protein N4T19_05840 [Comamonas sp. PR12]
MHTALGIGLVMTFNILQAVSAVFLASFLHRADTIVMLFCVFTIIAITFVVQMVRGGSNRIPKQAWGSLLLLNITTAASWSSFFFAVKYIEPALSSAFINSILPLATLSIEYLFTRRRIASRAEVLTSIALCVAMFITAATIFGGQSGRPDGGVSSYIIGLVMSAICGIAMSITNVASKKLNNEGVQPSQIMAYRFSLLIIASFLLVDKPLLLQQIETMWPAIVFVAVVGNLIPIYCLQLGIQRLKPMTVAFLIGLAPLIFFTVQSFNEELLFSYLSLVCTVLTTAILLAGTYFSIGQKPQPTNTKSALAPAREQSEY